MSVFEDLKEVRKTITKHVDAKLGEHHGSELCFKLNSSKDVINFKYNLHKSDYIKKLEREYKVSIKSSVDSNHCYVQFEPSGFFFTSPEVELSLGNFLYITSKDNILKKFIETYHITEDNYKVGCSSVQALIQLCIWLSGFKNRFFIEMSKFSILKVFQPKMTSI